MRVLVVEDSEKLRRAVQFRLRKEGYAVDSTGDGSDGLWHAETYDYDVIVLDLMLPTMDGLSVVQKLRRSRPETPVLMLTVKSALEDKVAGLRAGADDYLGKPFEFEELLARIEALVRRRYGARQPIINAGDLELDTRTRNVLHRGKPLDLTPREYRLLELLIRQAGTVLSRTEIEEHIYGGDAEVFSNAVESAVSNIRRKFEEQGVRVSLQTRRGMGYVLCADVPGPQAEPGGPLVHTQNQAQPPRE